MDQEDREDSQRIDLWLWYTRFFKTRSLAAAAVGGGHVRVNGERVKAARKIRGGDRVSILRNQLQFEVTVLSLPGNRGPAKNAPSWYEESPESRSRREEKARVLREDRQLLPRTDGKPDKRTRRALRQHSRRGDP
jgi:ribosome-associated heat shock protein Hsp15